MKYVYEITTTGSDGSTRRHLPLYSSRRRAKEVAETHEDADPAYREADGSGRWKIRITRLPVEDDA